MYKLHAPLINSSNTNITTIKMLFKKVLGYTNSEIDQFIKTKFMCDIAINLSLEQAKQISEIFKSHEITIYLFDQQNNIPLAWQKDLGIILSKNPPQNHYCDEPLISREHLVDPYTQQAKEREYNIQQSLKELNAKPVVECPYCKSTDTKKITKASKAAHTFFFGFLSVSRNTKEWHCNNCNSDF